VRSSRSESDVPDLGNAGFLVNFGGRSPNRFEWMAASSMAELLELDSRYRTSTRLRRKERVSVVLMKRRIDEYIERSGREIGPRVRQELSDLARIGLQLKIFAAV